MSERQMGLAERATLLVLMGEAKEIANPELKARFGFEITKKTRELLVGRGLIACREVGRWKTIHYTLTKTGWQRCGQELRTDFAVPSRPAKVVAAAMKAMSLGLARYCDRLSLSPHDVFEPANDDGASGAWSPMVSELELRIRSAYARLASRPNHPVRLSRLRPLLDGFSVEDVDAELIRLYADRAVNLAPEENQKTLKQADRDAAVRAGGQAKHLLMIGDR